MKHFILKNTPDFLLHFYYVKLRNNERAYDNYKLISRLKKLPKEQLTNEQKEMFSYLKYGKQFIFPYPFTEKYKNKEKDVEVFRDDEKQMFYVMHCGKRLYFRKDWDQNNVKVYYNWISLEQDEESPHHYLTENFYVQNGDVVIDAGTAEGNFALENIEKVKKIYLFEVEEAWIEALQATFEPWEEKVVIVNKFVSDKTDVAENTVALDDYFKDEKIDFIKADIEGAEPKLVEGAKKILSQNEHIKIILCTYHYHNDADILQKMLITLGFKTEFSKGYMIYNYYEEPKPPYIRKCLIRAEK